MTPQHLSFLPFLQRIAERLVPPAAAEHVLGDLAESSPTSRVYIGRILAVLPYVVWSQVRRRATIGGMIFNVIFSGFFLVLFLRIPKEPFLDVPSNWMRLCAVLAVWVIGGSLATAYGPKDKPSAWSGSVFGLTFIAAVVTAAAAGVPVLRVVAALAVLFATGLVLSMPMLTHRTPPPLSMATIDAHARLFQRAIWWRNGREALGALVVLTMNARDLFTVEAPLKWTGHLLLVLGTLFIVSYLFIRARARPVPAADALTLVRFHQSELARQRDILRTVPTVYFLPFVPGAVLIAASNTNRSPAALVGALIAFAAIMGGVWWLNLAGARYLDAQLKQVAALPAFWHS